MLLSLESVVIVGAFVVNIAGATKASRSRSGTLTGRGRRTCANGNGGSPGTWEILSFPRKLPGGGYRVTNPRPDAAARSGGGSETCVIPWYRQTKETKCGGTGGRKSE